MSLKFLRQDLQEQTIQQQNIFSLYHLEHTV